jgi:hypothetical protein
MQREAADKIGAALLDSVPCPAQRRATFGPRRGPPLAS